MICNTNNLITSTGITELKIPEVRCSRWNNTTTKTTTGERYNNPLARTMEDQNAPITADLRDINGAALSVDFIPWRRLAVSSRNVAIYILSDHIVRQTIIHSIIIVSSTMNKNNLFSRHMQHITVTEAHTYKRREEAISPWGFSPFIISTCRIYSSDTFW